MIESIGKDKFINRYLIYLFLLIFFIMIGQALYINNIFKKVQVRDIDRYQGIAGRLKEKYNISESVIADSFLEYPSKEEEIIGKEFFEKYGYSSNLDEKYNKFFYSEYKNIKTTIYFSSILGFGLIIILFVKFLHSILLKVDEISKSLKLLYEGKKVDNLDDTKEGVFSLLNYRFNTMINAFHKSLKEVEEERKKLKELLNDLSHQLKTPISSIKLFNDFLRDENLSCEDKKEFINTIEKDIERLQWITEGLLQLSRLETESISLYKRELNLKDTLLEAINSLYAKALNKNIDINLENIDNYKFIYDYKWTKEALINIIDNAIKYTDENGMISIYMKKEKTSVSIVIEDNGIGINKKEIFKVFNRFYRSSDIVVQKQEGSGLGLYLSRKIIEEQGGTIKLDSEKGIGSKFTITFYEA